MALIDHVAHNPEAGEEIGGGVRKFRFARQGGGKSGGYRVTHFYSGDGASPVFLLTVFAKSRMANHSRAEIAELKSLGKALAREYGRQQ